MQLIACKNTGNIQYDTHIDQQKIHLKLGKFSPEKVFFDWRSQVLSLFFMDDRKNKGYVLELKPTMPLSDCDLETKDNGEVIFNYKTF